MKKAATKIISLIRDNFFAEENRYIVLVPFLFALGIAFYFALPQEPSPWLSVGLFEFFLLIFYLCRRKQSLHFFFIGIIIIFCGFLNMQIRTLYQQKRLQPLYEKSVTYISGRIKDISLNQNHKTRLLLQDVSDYEHSLKGEYRLTLTNSPKNLQIGDCVETVATLFPNRPLPILDGYQIDRKYFFENIAAVGFTNSETFKINCPKPQNNHGFAEELNLKRKQIISKINQILPASQASIAAALLVGDKNEISPALVANYRNSGLAHILAVSGLHLGAVAGLIFFIIRFLIALFPALALRFDSKKIAAVTAIIGSAFYLLISGMAIPAQRAFIMTTVVLIGILFNRRAISVRMVCFAALVILIISPQSLASISFQMSFAAVFALISFYETYAAKLADHKPRNFFLKIIWYLAGIVICDLVASLATLPFTLYHFHRFAVYTSLANLLAGPLVGLYIIPMVLLCLISFIFGLYSLPLKLLGLGTELLNNIAYTISELPHCVWFYSLGFGAFICIIMGGYWLCIWQKTWRRWGIFLIAIGTLAAFYPTFQPDFVFSENAEQIAIKDRNNEMVLLPLKKDTWIQQLWQENFNLKKLSETERNKIKNILISFADNDNELNLSCAQNKCIYNNIVHFDLSGNISLNDETLDTSAGGYIYSSKSRWQPLWSTEHCRPWRRCKQK